MLFLMSMKTGIENEIFLPGMTDLPYRHCQQQFLWREGSCSNKKNKIMSLHKCARQRREQ